VAAVFSYVMLGAGFFATGEAQRVVDTGVAQASSAVELSGPVIVQASSSTGGGSVGEIKFFLQLAAGGAPVDMQKVTFTVATAGKMQTYIYGDETGKKNSVDTGVTSKWYAEGSVQGADKNDLLEKFETVEIKISGTTDKPLPAIVPNDWFTVEVKPDVGATLPIKRVAPPDLRPSRNYEVF
jgi:flagellin FlaB